MTSPATDTSINVQVLYFARLADIAQCDQQRLNIASGTSLSELYQRLDSQYGFNTPPSQLRVAINDNFANWSDDINDGDSIAFIPPMAGG